MGRRLCPPGNERAEALVHLGRIRLEDDLREATLLLTEALEQEGSSAALRAEALTHLAVVHLNLGNLGEAERNARLAVDLAEESGDPYLIADALVVHAVPQAYMGGGIDHDALARAEALAGGAERFRADWDRGAVSAELFVVFDRTDEAREIFLNLLDLAVERGRALSVVHPFLPGPIRATSRRLGQGPASLHRDEALG